MRKISGAGCSVTGDITRIDNKWLIQANVPRSEAYHEGDTALFDIRSVRATRLLGGSVAYNGMCLKTVSINLTAHHDAFHGFSERCMEFLRHDHGRKTSIDWGNSMLRTRCKRLLSHDLSWFQVRGVGCHTQHDSYESVSDNAFIVNMTCNNAHCVNATRRRHSFTNSSAPRRMIWVLCQEPTRQNTESSVFCHGPASCPVRARHQTRPSE